MSITELARKSGLGWVARKRLERFAELARAPLQAKIDGLMLEYCPDEITDEQMAEWSKNQKPVSECRHCGWLCMPNDNPSKKWNPLSQERQWVDLTDDEIEEIGKSYFDEWSFGFARAVIAADREKNK